MGRDGTGRLDLGGETGPDGWAASGDARAGQWLVERTTGSWHQVGALLPEGFPAYVRIFHPAYRRVSDPEAAEDTAAIRFPDGTRRWEREVPWTEVALANGRLAHPSMEWVSITGSEGYLHGDDQPGIWDEEPLEGSLPLAQSRALIATLAAHTTTAERCWFAIWEGYGSLAAPRGAGRLLMPNRPMLMFSGPITSWITHQAKSPRGQSPSLWWPEDRAWCVATDVDLMSTYLGSSESCAEDLLANDALEVMRISLDQPTTWDQDTVNPRPRELGDPPSDSGGPAPGSPNPD